MSGGDVDLQAIPHDGSHLTPDQARTIDAYLIEALDALNALFDGSNTGKVILRLPDTGS